MSNISQIFDDSYTRVRVNFDDFITEFYQCFLDRSDVIQTMFSDTDVNTLRNMLMLSFEHLLKFHYSRNSQQELARLAELHRDLGVDGAMYSDWMEALISAVKVMDYEFTREIELAWRVTLAPGIELMKHA